MGDIKDKLNKKELEAVKKVKDYKLICESNIVSILWKNTDLYFEYDKSYVVFSFYIDMKNIKLNGDIIQYNENLLLYIYPMTKIKDINSNDLWFIENPKNLLHQNVIGAGGLKIHKLIKFLIDENRVYFSDNFTGDKFYNLIGE